MEGKLRSILKIFTPQFPVHIPMLIKSSDTLNRLGLIFNDDSRYLMFNDNNI